MTTEDGVVSVDGQGSHATVGDGIAASVPGSEVRICPGTYVETLSIAHDLQLVSEGGPTVTTIDGNDGGPTVSVGAGTVSITGLTITGGSSVGLGGGLSITGTDPVTVTDCLIVGNQSSDGAGIYTSSGAQLSLQQTTVAENLGEIGGGLMFQGSSLSVSQCTFTDNISGEVGGGMVIFGLPAVQLSDTAITDNQSLDGGGLAVEAASLDLQDCTIERNSASSSGGSPRRPARGATTSPAPSSGSTASRPVRGSRGATSTRSRRPTRRTSSRGSGRSTWVGSRPWRPASAAASTCRSTRTSTPGAARRG